MLLFIIEALGGAEEQELKAGSEFDLSVPADQV